MTEMSTYTSEQYATDLRIMIDADTQHRADALVAGDIRRARQFEKQITARRRDLIQLG